KVQEGQAQVDSKMAAATKRVADLDREGAALQQSYAGLRARLADNERLAQQVDALNRKVDVIGEKLGFTPTSTATTAQRQGLEQAFEGFAGYLRNVGYVPTAGTVGVEVRALEQGAVAYYDPSKRTMYIDSKYASNPRYLYREYMHHVLGHQFKSY